MNWSDETYVKLYRRETATSRSWPWQTTALWPNLLKHVDGAGILEFGRLKPEHAVSVVTGLPIAVVAIGLKALVDDGTIELRERALIIPNFIEAQEARKSEALKKADQRERHRAKVRLEAFGTTQPPVPQCPPQSPAVPLQLSSAQPSPLKDLRAKKPPAVPKFKKPVDPRHAPLVKALVEAVPGYGFEDRDAAAVTRLLAKGDPGEVLLRWRRANARSDFPKTRTLSELATNWAHFAADSTKGHDPDEGIIKHRLAESAPIPAAWARVLDPQAGSYEGSRLRQQLYGELLARCDQLVVIAPDRFAARALREEVLPGLGLTGVIVEVRPESLPPTDDLADQHHEGSNAPL